MAAQAVTADKEKKFLADIQSGDEDVRYAAWAMADQMDPAVVPELSKLLTHDEPGVRKAAEESLKNVVHGVGKEINPEGLRANAGRPDDPGERDKRQQVVAQLLALLDGGRAEIEKVTALRHLSLIATVDDVDAIAGLIQDPELREEVVFCLERIPGKTSEEALLAALPKAEDEFKPRILAALGHRRAEEAMGACLEAMQSPDLTLAMAGMKAAGRIGSRRGGEIRFPDYDALSDWQKTEYVDSLLRWADAQVERGAPEEAWPIYREALGREEEHWQCAAIIGLAKIGTAEAAAAIFPKLSSDDNTVRITAQKAWHHLERVDSGD
jgi:HEAT repeat protein